MTKFKKYLRQNGYKLENDYPYMPFNFPTMKGAPILEGVRTYYNSERKCIVIANYYTSAICLTYVDNHGKKDYDYNFR